MKLNISIFFIAVLAFASIGNSGKTDAEKFLVDTTYSTSDTIICTYWITIQTGIRHNAKCKWYNKSNGYCTDKREGVACKKCGG